MSEDYEKWDDELDEAGEEININLDDWKDDEESSTSPVEGVTTSSATSSSAQPDIVSTLYAVFKGEKEPQFGIGYDWDMLFAVYMRKANVKPKEATGMAWNAATVAEFKSAVSNGDEASFARAILTCVGGSDVCKVSAEVLGVTGSQTSKPEVIKGITQNLIKKYFAAYGVSVSAEGITCKQAYDTVNKSRDAISSVVDFVMTTLKIGDSLREDADFIAGYYDQLTSSVDGYIDFLQPIDRKSGTQSIASFDFIEWQPATIEAIASMQGKLMSVRKHCDSTAGVSFRTLDTDKTADCDRNRYKGGTPESNTVAMALCLMMNGKCNYRPYWHACNAKSNMSVNDIASLMYKEFYFGLTQYFKSEKAKGIVTEIQEVQNNVMDSVKSAQLYTEIQNLVLPMLNSYRSACKNFITLRQEPETTGVFWIDMHYQYCKGLQFDFKALDSMFQSMDTMFKGTMNTGGSQNSEYARVWGENVETLFSGVQKDTSGIDNQGTSAIYTFVAVVNPVVYAGAPLFASKPIRKLQQLGVQFDVGNILVGKDMANQNYMMSLKEFPCTSLFATSRAGKGVMTLAMLASALSGGSSVIYADCKPDMSAAIWKIEQQLGSGRFLACDFGSAQLGSDCSDMNNWYSKQGFSQQNLPPMYTRMSERVRVNNVNPTRKAFCDMYDSIAATLGLKSQVKSATVYLAPGEKSDPFGSLSYLKFVYLAQVYRRKAHPSAKPLIVVLDEINNVYLGLRAWAGEFTANIKTLYRECVAKIKECNDNIKKLNKKAEKTDVTAELQEAQTNLANFEATKKQLDALISIISRWLFTINTKAGAFTSASGNVENFITTSGIATDLKEYLATLPSEAPVNFLVVGQDYNVFRRAIGADSHNATSAEVAAAESITYNIMSALLGRYITTGGASQALQGNWNNDEDIAYYSSSAEVQVARRKQYLHQGLEGFSGFWAVKRGKSVNVFKSYLILNNNDFVQLNNGLLDKLSVPYTHNTLLRTGGCQSSGTAETTVAICANPSKYPVQFDTLANLFEDSLAFKREATQSRTFPANPGVLDKAVGFDGLIQLLSGGNADISKNAENVYKALLEIIQAANPNYKSIEDYLFDYSYEGMMLDLVNGGLAGVEADSMVPEEAGTADNSAPVGDTSFFTMGAQPSATTSSAGFSNPVQVQVEMDEDDNVNFDTSQWGTEEQSDPPAAQQTDEPSQPIQSEPQATQEPYQPATNTEQSAAPTRQPVSGASQQAQFSPPMPAANPNSTTQSCSAYANAYTEPISFGSGSDTPFACFHSGGKYTNLRIRKAVSNYLIKEIKRVFGGLDAVISIEEQNGVLVVNNVPFTPKLDEATIVLAPYAMQADLRRGAYASVLFYKDLRLLERLQYLSFETNSIVDLFFFDNNISTDITKLRSKCLSKWKRLRVLRAYGENLLEISAEQSVAQKRECEVKERREGSSIGSFLASVTGIETNTADSHPVATQLGRTKLARAAKTGVLVGGMTWGMSLLLGLSNPFLLVGGAITAAAYAKSKWDEHRINRSAITAATSTRNKRDEHRTNRGK